MLLKGKSRTAVADRLNLSEAEVFKIEEEYYASQEQLSEHAMLMKQIARLEKVMDTLYDMALDSYTEVDAKLVEQLLKSIDLVSELAGLKKQKVEAEVRLIAEQQVPIIINYVDYVQSAMMEHITPLLTKRGQRQLEAHRDEWLAEATTKGAEIIDAPTVTMKM